MASPLFHARRPGLLQCNRLQESLLLSVQHLRLFASSLFEVLVSNAAILSCDLDTKWDASKIS
jgi:hypothetical protein